jgi:hypothetical protein
VATLRLLSVGGEADAALPASPGLDVTVLGSPPARTRRATRLRLVRVCRRGWILLLVAWLAQGPRPLGRFVPARWPAVPEAAPARRGLTRPQTA